MTKDNVVLIIAGHYCVSEAYSDLSHLSETEVMSLRMGIEQYQSYNKQGIEAKLVIWVNDIGLEPHDRKRYQQNYQLPSNYADLIKQDDISLNNIVIRFESQARNRASKVVRQLKKLQPDLIKEQSSKNRNLKRCVDADICSEKPVITIDDRNGFPLVIKEGGAAKCCAIFATFLTELVTTFQPVIIVGVFNFVYIERIKTGIYVAQSLFNFDTPARILFCDERRMIHSEEFKGKSNDE